MPRSPYSERFYSGKYYREFEEDFEACYRYFYDSLRRRRSRSRSRHSHKYYKTYRRRKHDDYYYRHKSRSPIKHSYTRRSSSSSSSHRAHNRHRSSQRGSTDTVVSRSAPPVDSDGHFQYQKGDGVYHNRYVVRTQLGEGTFGRVLRCIDTESKQEDSKSNVALKIIRRVKKYRTAAAYEVNVLNKLAEWDPHGEYGCVKLISSFEWHGHACLVFPLLGQSVFEVMRQRGYISYTIREVRDIGAQLVRAVGFLHSHKLTHTDLKPENMLFVGPYRPDSSEIKLIDFGSTTFDHEHHTRIVSTRHYRSPEVILEAGWSQSCDVWSIGAILYELWKGRTLFQTHANRTHLAMMAIVLGRRFPKRLIDISKKQKYFRSNGDVIWNDDSDDHHRVKNSCTSLSPRLIDPLSPTLHEEESLIDLIIHMLDLDPETRVTCSTALHHPFFKNARFSHSVSR